MNVRDIRVGLGLTQFEFGQLFGIGQDSISKWEGGHTLPSRYRQQILEAFAEGIERGNVSSHDFSGILERCGPVYTFYRILHAGYGLPL